MRKKTAPIKNEEEVAKNPDKKIDEDFKGFPHGHASKKIIKPKTKNDKKTARVDKENK
ncbi:hypothetical protein ACFS6H_16115 [Terrimonas rubra]|uniref:Uncharacterized protein n=1 Tax=Terrimonas rubra TaxID=1035890 RepID=A0ABW6A918_9BACT